MTAPRLNKNILLALGLLALTLSGCSGPVGPPPNAKKVSDTLAEIKKEEITRLQEEARSDYVTGRISLWLQDAQFYIRFAAIAGGAGLVGFLLFLLIRYVSARTYERKRPAAARPVADSPLASPAQLELLAAAGDYSQAVLRLHRLTILHLHERKILLSPNLTNYVILARCRDQHLRRSFRLIAETSERILFDRASATADDFTRCHDAFLSAFREARR